jgi:cytochrome c-type biogenesis protein CcmE
MNPKRRRRLIAVVLIVTGIGIAAALGLSAFQENLLFFFSPTQIEAGEAPRDRAFRLGGLVKNGTVQRDPDSLRVQFVITDTLKEIQVDYTGILPDLFREGQGIVALGRLGSNGVFLAEEVLAKHDENYMPPEVADALKTAHEEGVKQAREAAQ